MEEVWKAYVCEVTPTLERLTDSVSSTLFVRFWRQHCFDNKINKDFFMTQNAWEGLEINLATLLRLILDGEAQNVFQQNSQEDEKFFRKERAFTPIGSTNVNFDTKEFKRRAHKIGYEQKIYKDIDGVDFPKMEKKSKLPIRKKEFFKDADIGKAIIEGVERAKERAISLGITNFQVELDRFLKPPAPENDRKKKKKTKTEYRVRNPFEACGMDPEVDPDVDSSMTLQNVTFPREISGKIILKCRFQWW